MHKLTTKRVDKPWGRRDLAPWFDNVPSDAPPVGEIWYETREHVDPELLVKYLFTSERLSIQVHPDDAAAQLHGYPRGKDEAWVVIAATPEAEIGIGLKRPTTRAHLREAALSGEIEQLIDWRRVKAGDVIYSPAGTVHAIGAGVTVVEVQQNVDLTYRLYDYGRPRELHLDDGIAVSDPVPFVGHTDPHVVADGRQVYFDGPKFVLERWSGGGAARVLPAAGRPVWIAPLAGSVSNASTSIGSGEVGHVDDASDVHVSDDADLLVAYPGRGVVRSLRG